MRQISLDRAFALLVVVVALASGLAAFGYSVESSYFPRLLSAFLVVVAGMLLFRLARTKADAGTEDDEARALEREEQKEQIRSALLVFGAIAAYIGAIHIVNYEIATVLFVSIFIRYLGYRNLLVTGIAAVALTALLYGVFFEFLAVARPESLFFS
ncbi:tripartite tricarboxylate transporter TctB family protein [Sneathiella chinensis]|uniref:DUF1468 domain-containing protein n=1 Tax=Sneathiella chinensis TaxID=349750 RepID=A0ABQ5U2H7_9PROT|nr:tripartite tricarboxylate transporter TctB family protein [Sneathiella chinensis]GLQ05881.1 hypothetical protein GCM10007924_11020 [Sneathiella chinensis]